MVCAACCHMALVFAIMHLYYPPPPSLFIFFFNQVLILNQTDWSTISECPSFVCCCCFFFFLGGGGHIEGTNSSKICV